MASKGDLFGEMWKEYAFSDSRYITRDAFVVCMEATTAVDTSPLLGTLLANQHCKALWGPLSYCVAWMITTKHPLRYPLQAVVTLGQLYGLELYYATSLFDHYVNGMTYFRPEPYYFWVYYFFLNFIWVVFPGSKTPDYTCNDNGMSADVRLIVLLVNSIRASAKAFATLDKQSKTEHGNGNLKKSN